MAPSLYCILPLPRPVLSLHLTRRARLPIEARKLPGAAFEAEDVLVVEDAPSGLKAGLAAGCKTLGVGTGQPLERFRTFDATVKALDLTRWVGNRHRT